MKMAYSKEAPPIGEGEGFLTVQAVKFGDNATKLSALVFGLGNLLRGQAARFGLYLAAELSYLIYMAAYGFRALANLGTLGTATQRSEYSEALGIYETLPGDNSMLFLLYGVITLLLTIGFFAVMASSVRSAYMAQLAVERGKKPDSFSADLKSLLDGNLHKLLMSWPMLGILMFTIVPLAFMILIAFTNYDHEHQVPGNLFTWAGFSNFGKMLDTGSAGLGSFFFPILGWTLIWAFFATFSNYFLGMVMALLINRKDTKLKALWRFMFVLSIALPQFVSLLVMRTIFNNNGPFNIMLMGLGLIKEPITWWADPFKAKMMIIIVNIWIGIPYTIMQITGILQNIPAELYEAATVDGAGPAVTFFQITLPYMLFVTTPYLITTFTGNINNFNVIFLLTGGGPNMIGPYNAGHTDLLVTWLYKLTINAKDYSLGSVIGIMVFVLLAVASLVTYRNTGTFKNEEEFQK